MYHTNYNPYLKHLNDVFCKNDIDKFKQNFDNEIQTRLKQIDDFVAQAEQRIKIVEEYEQNKQFCILGSTYKEGRTKNILLIIRYEDFTQRDERYSFNTIKEMRTKLAELKEKYNWVDWSGFNEEI